MNKLFVTNRKSEMYQEAPRSGRSCIYMDLVFLYYHVKLTKLGGIVSYC